MSLVDSFPALPHLMGYELSIYCILCAKPSCSLYVNTAFRDAQRSLDKRDIFVDYQIYYLYLSI